MNSANRSSCRVGETGQIASRAAPSRSRCSAPPNASVKRVAGNCGKGAAQRLQAFHQQGNWKHRIDRQRQLRLDVVGHALGARPQCAGPHDQRARVVDDCPPGLGQPRRLVRPVEERDPKRRLERLNRLADRRLHAAERSCRGRKAAGVGDSDQNAHLVQRERINHGPSSRVPSSIPMISTTIWPIVMMLHTLHIVVTDKNMRLMRVVMDAMKRNQP